MPACLRRPHSQSFRRVLILAAKTKRDFEGDGADDDGNIKAPYDDENDDDENDNDNDENEKDDEKSSERRRRKDSKRAKGELKRKQPARRKSHQKSSPSLSKSGGNKKKGNGNGNGNGTGTGNGKSTSMSMSTRMSKEEKQKLIARALQEELKKSKSGPQSDQPRKSSVLDMVNPFKAGKRLRQTLEDLGGIPSEKDDIYYLDDRLQGYGGQSPLFSERNPLLERLERDAYAPEVLVVGATGEVGRLVVRRLLLEGKCRVRVLVRDLYSRTLDMLGTEVTYCQGDLTNPESLEYALTDVDKIVFCAAPPKPHEEDFQDKFRAFLKENEKYHHLHGHDRDRDRDRAEISVATRRDKTSTDSDLEWDRFDSVLRVRAQLAEQIDCTGMQNLVRAYQNVRFADYGTSQTAKRSLFKFKSRPEDFTLFVIDEHDEDEHDEDEHTHHQGNEPSSDDYRYDSPDPSDYGHDAYDDIVDEYAEYDAEELQAAARKGRNTKSQCFWLKNEFGHAVFVGRVPKGEGAVGGQSSVVSGRLRSRDDPEDGVDLGTGFGGFILRVCSDGGRYEAFVRMRNYETDGVEYVYEFQTDTKEQRANNKSRNKFTTVRLPFENFVPVLARKVRGGKSGSGNSGSESSTKVPPFRGKDVRQIGFRYRSDSNRQRNRFMKGDYSQFYLALSYIKVYRSQPEPEFVYLSDARIPAVSDRTMVRRDMHQLTTKIPDSPGVAAATSDAFNIFDDTSLAKVAHDAHSRIKEETYYKFRGEEILKNSGLSYAIIRISGFNDVPTGEASTIELTPSNEEITTVARADVAQVCASALLDPNALNKSFYMSKTKQKPTNPNIDEDISLKFANLPGDA